MRWYVAEAWLMHAIAPSQKAAKGSATRKKQGADLQLRGQCTIVVRTVLID